MVTLEQMIQLIPKNKNAELWHTALVKTLPDHEITSKLRVSAFLAECIYESNQFLELTENLNYSAEGLCKTWPSRFVSLEFAKNYAHKPEAIANLAYANRLGNGPETSGDGWKYRGAGIMQLTGKENQKKFADFIGVSIEEVSDYLITPEGAITSACFYWDTHKLSSYADLGQIDKISEIINGGKLGLAERNALFQKILNLEN